jgi:DNA-binding response OmpR family regulator
MLVDLMMPNMHGSVFAMRARDLAPDVPILFMTGYDDAHWFGNAANETVLRKPFRRSELAAHLRGMLGTARQPH